mgnify:FL=1
MGLEQESEWEGLPPQEEGKVVELPGEGIRQRVAAAVAEDRQRVVGAGKTEGVVEEVVAVVEAAAHARREHQDLAWGLGV